MDGVEVNLLRENAQEVDVVLRDLVVQGQEFYVLQAQDARVRQHEVHGLGLADVGDQVIEEGDDADHHILGGGLAEDLQQPVERPDLIEISTNYLQKVTRKTPYHIGHPRAGACTVRSTIPQFSRSCHYP